MVFVIGLLTAILVLDCLLLILLVLMQLPKKEAGAGLAFGGAATDALFGAGSGNFLTKTTKYAAVTFFVLCIILAVMQNSYARRPGSRFLQELERESQAAAAATPSTSAQPVPGAVVTDTNLPAGGLLLPQNAVGTNEVIAPETTVPANSPVEQPGQ